MLIGVDFDNTLAGYDHVFVAAAGERGWLPPGFAGGKREVRDAVRGLVDGERRWMELQGEVYGPRMPEAELIDGADRFLTRCRSEGMTVVVVSHKTEFGHFDPTRTRLHDAARAWMTAKGFFDQAAFAVSEAFFEPTREGKIARIKALGCDVFIDDLEEVFLAPGFPAACRRLHLAGAAAGRCHGPFASYPGWAEIHDAVFPAA
ncbi:hypothetical protein [Paramagnetospirillum magneticum]|uniref:Haloacid dehalogenase-like hydrolase n=1 Tax=Paramagnetospirillum magneticum (strain ATCC 700264 / AMB-1) TaxID=342108 RepID=Q2WBA7_PARM1|nr:hypothetical protein [Paramagnetospirillum magneticum]BAE48868.1 hypothetical protein amb0064 [Paramagnetospirillum magneticum AMB-1]